ncbi:uncharacterized protein LOC124929600 [Impatiens glandulifera]|uniref:uncharacterized protein LOC124929600 n=1 Tax=Impatiens glandulifera TaxID=253017 RepID=UPI001FB17496|nr:uncharacterized protein LOC124929600 [Impatiens glandulifera]
MEQQQLKQHTSIRQKHPPAVPFLWEERPGTAKHHWKPDTTTTANVATIPPPLKLIASVPFEWEELPGKPFSCFSHPPENTEQQILPVLALPPPPAYSEDIIPLLSEDRDVEYYGLRSEADASLCSNISTEPASYNAVDPVDWNSSPSSPESESEGTYGAGGASLVGVSFLERLFPLLSSHQGGLRQNAGNSYSETGSSSMATVEEKEGGESKACVVARRVHTLGELIMMSRRISRKRKAIQIQRQGLSMEVIDKSDLCMGGCMFGVIDKIGGGIMHWPNSIWKKTHHDHFHRLKFM